MVKRGKAQLKRERARYEVNEKQFLQGTMECLFTILSIVVQKGLSLAIVFTVQYVTLIS